MDIAILASGLVVGYILGMIMPSRIHREKEKLKAAILAELQPDLAPAPITIVTQDLSVATNTTTIENK